MLNSKLTFEKWENIPLRLNSESFPGIVIIQLTVGLIKTAVSWKFGHCYFLRDFFDALCGNY